MTGTSAGRRTRCDHVCPFEWLDRQAGPAYVWTNDPSCALDSAAELWQLALFVSKEEQDDADRFRPVDARLA